jgi:predicted ABC-type ATPase
MSDPILHLVAGPNGAGKSTLYARVIGPASVLEFVNADVISAQRWPDDPVGKSYEAAVVAAERRMKLIENGMSFVTETVFSHESKLELVHAALDAGYIVTLHVVIVPEALAVAGSRTGWRPAVTQSLTTRSGNGTSGYGPWWPQRSVSSTAPPSTTTAGPERRSR